MTKPQIPLTVVALASVAIAGLITQFLAAETAFALIGRTALYSIAAALLIELAIVVDAVVVARNRNLIALSGLLIAMAVSAVYNYTLADLAQPDYTLQNWQKIALALGPLFALTTIGLALGEELYRYSVELDAYNQERVALEREQQAEAYREEHKARLDAIDRQRAQVAFDRELERERQAFELREKQLATRRAERWARATEKAVQTVQSVQSDNGHEPASALDELLALDKYALDNHTAFGKACAAHPELAARITPKALAIRTGKSQRSARRWCAQVRM